MKKLTATFCLTLTLLLGSVGYASADELKSGKVVFSISDAKNSYRADIKKDDMDEFEGYRNFVGCDYKYLVTNFTDKKIKILNFFIGSDLDFKTAGSYYSSSKCGKLKKCYYVVNTQSGVIIKPNYKVEIQHLGVFEENPGEALQGIYADLGLSKKRLTNKETQIALKKYGCEAQKGKVYLSGPGIIYNTIVYFSKKENISDGETFNYIGFEDGTYPLKKGF